MIEEAIEKLAILLQGKIPEKIDIEKLDNESEHKFGEILNQVIDSIQEIHEFIIPLSRGELQDIRVQAGNFLASPFKELHSSLLHLTWQAKQVANGDYKQRVDFMGDFSEAFNSMIISLDHYEKRLKRQAVFDALTGIPNHRGFLETISKEFKRSRRDQQPLSIIMCDIDNFKAYNDTYGHSSGDLCLKKVAQTINNTLKRPVDFCARYGGEEFVVILPNTALDGAMQLAEKIRLNIEGMGIKNKKSLPTQIVTLSLGVATSEDTTLVSHEELIKCADMGLYKAKEQGRNQVQSFSEIA